MTRRGHHTAGPAPFDVFVAPLQGTQLLEASAGTGKTWTLTALHLRLLLEAGLPISGILVVTFTEAAVAELRTRVRERLLHARDALDGHAGGFDPAVARIVTLARERTGLDDGTLRTRVTRALAEFDDAPISTIHAFCQRVLRESAFAAHLPLEVETQTDDNELRLAAVRDFWRRQIATPDLSPRTAAQLARTNATPEQWEPLLRDALAFPLARRVWADERNGDERTQEAQLRAHEAERQRCFERVSASWRRENGRALDVLNQARTKPSYSEDRIARAHRLLARHFDAADPAAALERDPPKLFTRSWLDDQKSKKLASVPRLKVFDDLQALFDAHDAIDALLRADVARLKQRMLEHSTKHLREAKAAQGVQTFQDMLTRTHERLHTDAALVAAVRQRLPAALVDEFQDTDPVQLGIFDKLYRGGNACMFLVGDPKQAIYSFRGADLSSYLHARDGAGAHVWSLERNQRASPQLLHALNVLFSRHPHVFGDSRLAFRASEAGEARRKAFVDAREPDTTAALRIWSLPAGFDSTAAAKQAAARACAVDIARTLEAADAGLVRHDDRALRGGDIAVLVRTNVEGRTMRRALADVGVASVDLSRASVFASLDAAEIDMLLHATLDPGHTGKLRAAMASTLLGVDADRLAALHEVGTGDAVRDVTRDAQAVLETTLARLLAWRGTWQRHGIAAMLSQALDDVGAAERLLGGNDGERRMTNLLHLMELLGRQERETPLPQALLRWLGQQRTSAQGREDTQLRLESDRQLVQIVTVHRAKGLQYPIVVLPFLWSGNSPRRGFGARRYHDDDGAQVLDYRTKADLGDAKEGEVKDRLRDEGDAESLRLLYVALTRAQHRCTVVIDAQARGAGSGKHGSLRSMLNWIVAGQGDFAPWRGVDSKNADARSRLIEGAWRTLAQATPHASLAVLPGDDGTTVDLRGNEVREVHHFHAPGPIGASWRLGSFSSFLRADAAAAPDVLLDTLDPTLGSGVDRDAGMAAEGTGNDDADGPDSARDADDAAHHTKVIPDDDILRFPRGPAAGDAMHAVLERADFARPDTWPAACAAALRLHPQRACEQAQAMLGHMLADLTAVELAPGLALKDVGTAQRLDELEFDLPLPALRLERLESKLDTLGLAVPPLGTGFDASHTFRGHLRGFVDSVFEHRGRYYLADWKSNHLGEAPVHYAQPSLARTIVAHGYHLQHVLYAIALLRHLRRCLGDVQAQAAWGGAFVLFVRGIRPGWTDSHGRPTGVFHRRLEPTVLDELARCFG